MYPPYRFPSSSQYEDEDKSELSVIENLKKHLPWPLSMVGRLGEQQREETERYPDSIQSILSVVDPEEDSQYSRHHVLPFLDVEYDDNSLMRARFREENY